MTDHRVTRRPALIAIAAAMIENAPSISYSAWAPIMRDLLADVRRMDWLEEHVVNVRDKLLYGSRDMFWASPEGDEEATEYGPSDIRARIDAALAPTPPLTAEEK